MTLSFIVEDLDAYHSAWVISDEFVKDATTSLEMLGRLTLHPPKQPSGQ